MVESEVYAFTVIIGLLIVGYLLRIARIVAKGTASAVIAYKKAKADGTITPDEMDGIFNILDQMLADINSVVQRLFGIFTGAKVEST